MGKTLVLCVDRDNDFGTKAKVASPVIGRKNNLRAAIKLALADPEESDANSLFAAIKAYDELKAKNEPVEIGTVCGDPNVGDKSDHIISYQLGEIISKVQPETAILVSDGPEDEFVLPLLESRLKVREVRRVVVKQSERIEDTIYIIRKGMAKEQVRTYLIIPTALVLMISGLLTIIGIYAPQNLAFGIPAFGVGLLFLLQAMQIRERVEEIYKELHAGMMAGSVTIYTSLIALLIIFIAAALTYENTASSVFPTWEEGSVYFFAGFLWWIIPAILVRQGGYFADEYLRNKKAVWSHIYNGISWVAMVFLIIGGLTMVRYFLGYLHGASLDVVLREVAFYFVVTVSLAASAAMIYRYTRQKKNSDGGQLEPEPGGESGKDTEIF